MRVAILGVTIALAISPCVLTVVEAQAPIPFAEQGTFQELAWQPTVPGSVHDTAAVAQYRPNHWKLGLAIGAGVGVAASIVILATCTSDADTCPGWDRVAIALPLFTGLGGLVGALVPKGAPAPE